MTQIIGLALLGIAIVLVWAGIRGEPLVSMFRSLVDPNFTLED